MSFLKNKRVLILGLLSDRSIAYGIANAMHQQGAELAFTHQVNKHEQRVRKLAANFNSDIVSEYVVKTSLDIKNKNKVICKKLKLWDY